VTGDSFPSYKPIDCSFHDRLEHYSVRQELVEIVFEWNGQTLTRLALIKDVFASEGADYALIVPVDYTEGKGFTVRLDYLISVNGHVLLDSNVC